MIFRAAAVIFRATSRTIFSPATALPFFSWLRAPNTPLIAPILELLALHAQISPEPAQPLFLGRFAPNFFPQRYTIVFFMTLPAPTTPQFDPLRGLAALLPQFLRS